MFALPTPSQKEDEQDQAEDQWDESEGQVEQETTLRDFEGNEADRLADSCYSEIELDETSTELAICLDLLHFTRYDKLYDAWYIRLTISDARRLYPFLDKYDCEDVKKCVRCRLDALAPGDPWGVLHLAAERNDIPLGRVAISKLTPAHVVLTAYAQLHNTTQPPQSPYNRLPLEREQVREPKLRQLLAPMPATWQLELTNLLWTEKMIGLGESQANKTYSCLLANDFATAAAQFNPARFRS